MGREECDRVQTTEEGLVYPAHTKQPPAICGQNNSLHLD